MMNSKDNSGFRLPEGYFENFPERLEKRMNTQEAAPLPKDTGFRVPDGYFEDFESRLTQQLQQPKGKVRQLWRPAFGWTAAVAAAIVLALVFWPARQSETAGFEDLAATEIEAYLEEGFEDISPYEIAESLSLEEIGMEDVMQTGAREDLILEYLNEDEGALEEIYWEENE